jgi:hypothetical protein
MESIHKTGRITYSTPGSTATPAVPIRLAWPALSIAVLAVLGVLAPYNGLAHDIPSDVTVQAFLKPVGGRMLLLIRVPLKAMRDIDFPQSGPGYLDLDRVDPFLRDAAKVWISDALSLYEDDTRLPQPAVLAARASLESDRAFASYEGALAHIRGAPLANNTEIYWNQAMLDVLYEYGIHSERSSFSMQPGFSRLGLRVITALRFIPYGGDIRAFEFVGDPGLVRLDPRWHQAILRFVRAGFFHIFSGTDHLLFLFCLVIPIRRFRTLILVVTSFTAAHSVTLIASAYNIAPSALWFPPLIETLIAISIVYMALGNICGGKVLHSRWLVAFGFGLVHGFGFSFALRESLQFAGTHLLTSLLSFNIGVELGQAAVLLLLIPMLGAVFRFALNERIGTIVLSALVAHTGWHWMLERAARLTQYRLEWPDLAAAPLASALHWLMLIVFLAGLFCCLPLLRRLRFPPHDFPRRPSFEFGLPEGIASTNSLQTKQGGGRA